MAKAKTKGYVEKGLSGDKGVFIPKDQRAPDRPEYLHMSKADVIAAEKKRRATEGKVAAYRRELEAGIEEAVEEKVAEVEKEPEVKAPNVTSVAKGESAVKKKAKKA